MSFLFVFILRMIFISAVQSDKVPQVMCSYRGTWGNTSYVFSVSDIPDRCEVIVYGLNYFDAEPSDADKNAIKALTAANKVVYTFYSYADDVNWTSIISSDDTTALDQQIAPMISFISNNKVNVILWYLNLLAGDIPDYATKIKSLICKIKEDVPSVKVALTISGYMADEYGNENVFDFTVVNDVVDLYIIDTSVIELDCTPTTTADGGRILIKSKDKTKVTLKEVRKASSRSPMDQSKVLIYLIDYVSTMENGEEKYESYTEYCRQTDSHRWCADTMQMFYDNVKFVKKKFQGILISDLDFDDYDNSCGCGKFPVANTYIDAWQDKPIKHCDKI